MALAMAALTSVGVAVGVWFALQPAPLWTGDAAGAATLRARDRTGERDAATIVQRLTRLGVRADARDVARDGATVEVSGAADVQRAVHAVLEPGRFAVYAEAPPVGPQAAASPSGSAEAAASPAGSAEAAVSPSGSAEATPRSRVLEDCAQAPCAPVQVLLPATITNRELAGAARTADGLALTLTADGALQLEALTQRTVGRRLVVTIDDRIYAAPFVAARDHAGRLVLTVPAADADRLEAMLSGNPLAGRWELVGLAPR